MQSVFEKNEKDIIRVKCRTLDEIKKFVNLAEKLESDILIYSNHYVVDGRSLMGILSLSLAYPVDVRVVDDAERELFIKQLDELGIVLKNEEF